MFVNTKNNYSVIKSGSKNNPKHLVHGRELIKSLLLVNAPGTQCLNGVVPRSVPHPAHLGNSASAVLIPGTSLSYEK